MNRSINTKAQSRLGFIYSLTQQRHDKNYSSMHSNIFISKTLPAFTLSEVLLTLGIIGVVAAFTLPTLINNTNQKELTTKYKKTFSMLNSATKMIVALNGSLDTSTAANVITQYKSVMNTSVDAVFNDGIHFCNTQHYKYYKNNGNPGINYSTLVAPGFVTNDGTSLAYNFAATDCSVTVSGVTNTCGIWYIDVNGAKSPNMWGYDFYEVELVYRNGGYIIIPYGAGNGDTQTCVVTSTSSDDSAGCATNALLDTLP